MNSVEAWDSFAKLIRKLDPSNEIGHLCKTLKAQGFLITFSCMPNFESTQALLNQTLTKAPVHPASPEVIRAIELKLPGGDTCSNCGQIVSGVGCVGCPSCGTTTKGCT